MVRRLNPDTTAWTHRKTEFGHAPIHQEKVIEIRTKKNISNHILRMLTMKISYLGFCPRESPIAVSPTKTH